MGAFGALYALTALVLILAIDVRHEGSRIAVGNAGTFVHVGCCRPCCWLTR